MKHRVGQFPGASSQEQCGGWTDEDDGNIPSSKLPKYNLVISESMTVKIDIKKQNNSSQFKNRCAN